MFERYSIPARRAIYFANVLALVSDEPEITTVDLLASLLFDDDSRAQTIFRLREYFPLYNGCPCKYASVPKWKDGPRLTRESKMILAWTAAEATRMGDYWIDTEHLLLGILRVRTCTAARYLEMTGLSLRATRKTILQNKSSRPNYGAVPRLWPVRSRLKTLISWGWP